MAVLMREAIGGSLRRARTARGRTLRDVSRKANVSLGYLSEVERGRKEASSELLAAICEALDVAVHDCWPRRPRPSLAAEACGARVSRPGRSACGTWTCGWPGAGPVVVPIGTRHRPAGPVPARGCGWPPDVCRAQGVISGSPRPHRMIPDIVDARWNPDRSGATMGSRSRHVTRRAEADGQPFREGLEVPDGGVLGEDRRARRPEGADPAGHRGRAAPAPGAVPAGRGGDRQPAPAGDEAQPPARRGREAAGLGPPGAGAGRPGPRLR